jgi:enoyl-CoA hydratase/carnithine racemase/predicted thioesterase
MKNTLVPGITGDLSTHAGPGQTITLGGVAEATVFSTPSMIQLMEYCARQVLEPHLDEGEESVGVDVHISHTSATPAGKKVQAHARVLEIEKNVVLFEVWADDEWGEIGRGTHRRAVIETSQFAKRLTEHKGFEGPLEPEAQFQWLKCERHGALLNVVLDRVSKKNAMNQGLTEELEQLVTSLPRRFPEIRVVVVKGAGGNFSAGDDVGDLPQDPQEAAALSLRRGALFQRITELPQIFLAQIDGLCLGGGLVLASACDFSVASYRATLGLPEVTLGWPPNYGMGIVVSRVGRSMALDLAYSGQRLEAGAAKAAGLVNRVVPVAQMDAEIRNWTESLMQLPPLALRETKSLLAPGQSWSDEVATKAFLRCLAEEPAKRSISRFRS